MSETVQPLGPGSIYWRYYGDLRAMLFAGRALVYQVAHPVVGAGVGDHSVYRDDPYGRLNRTMASMNKQIYGGRKAAEEGQRLHEMHKEIKGVDALGRRYSAMNPEAYYWVHATMYELPVAFYRYLDTPLDDAETAQLFDEWQRLGRLLGLRDTDLPATQQEFWEQWDSILPKLENNAVVQDLLFNPPKKIPFTPLPQRAVDAINRPLLGLQRDLLVWSSPPELRERLGLTDLTSARRRRVERTAWLSHLWGRFPEPIRFSPPVYLVKRRALRAAHKELR